MHRFPVKRAKTTLEAVPNDLDDATHARLDRLVLDTSDYDPSSLPVAAFFLATIVSYSEDKLNSKYKDTPTVKALFNEHPELMDKLRVAWTARSFKEIRNLSAIFVMTKADGLLTLVQKSFVPASKWIRLVLGNFTGKLMLGARLPFVDKIDMFIIPLLQSSNY